MSSYQHKPTNIIIRHPQPTPLDPTTDKYHLLEIPIDLAKDIEESNKPLLLTIKGKPSDDAVICTPKKTYTLRSISISNSLLILRRNPIERLTSRPHKRRRISENGGDDEDGRGTGEGEEKIVVVVERETLELRDTVREILEMIPTFPKLDRINKILKETSWKGIGSTSTSTSNVNNNIVNKMGEGNGNGKIKRWTRKQLESVIQASDEELERGLKINNVIELNGHLIILPPIHLTPLLSIILSLLTLHSTSSSSSSSSATSSSSSSSIHKRKSPIQPILNSLIIDHQVELGIANGVLELFSVVNDGDDDDIEDEGMGIGETGKEWECDVNRVVREIGNGLLVGTKNEPMNKDQFLEKWKEQVGNAWIQLVDLNLLEGEYLLQPLPTHPSFSPLIISFPSSLLPTDPPTRFSELFLTRSPWLSNDIIPFLRGLVKDGDGKALDKLVSKFVRVVKGKKGEGEMWFPRRT